MLNILLFIIYLSLICWLLTKINFVKNAGIDPKLLMGLFLLKVAAGIAIGWVSLNYYGAGNDYWDINKYSWKEYQLLINDPKEYFTNIFKSHYENGYTNIFDSYASYWNDLRNYIVIKFISIIDIFTRGNYYVNSIFFGFLGFLGHIGLYRVFISIYKNKQQLVIIGCFLLPSMLYFSSGIHKDSVIFYAVGMVCYYFHDCFSNNVYHFKRILTIIFLLLLIFLIRNFIFLAILPALTAFFISIKKKWSPFRTFVISYAITGFLFFNISSVFPSINLPETIAGRQWDFKNQPWMPIANTDIYLNILYPNFRSFLNNTPQALNHSLMRPYITEPSSRMLLPFAIELFAYQVLLILFLLFNEKTAPTPPFIYFGLFFSLVVFLNIGYTIPNIASLIRYRSLYLPFVITPLLCLTNWQKIISLFQFKK
jgi:hypothetical protein